MAEKERAEGSTRNSAERGSSGHFRIALPTAENAVGVSIGSAACSSARGHTNNETDRAGHDVGLASSRLELLNR